MNFEVVKYYMYIGTIFIYRNLKFKFWQNLLNLKFDNYLYLLLYVLYML